MSNTQQFIQVKPSVSELNVGVLELVNPLGASTRSVADNIYHPPGCHTGLQTAHRNSERANGEKSCGEKLTNKQKITTERRLKGKAAEVKGEPGGCIRGYTERAHPRREGGGQKGEPTGSCFAIGLRGVQRGQWRWEQVGGAFHIQTIVRPCWRHVKYPSLLSFLPSPFLSLLYFSSDLHPSPAQGGLPTSPFHTLLT